MIIFELLKYIEVSTFVPEDSSVYSVQINTSEQADWWTDVFGAPDETSTERIFVGAFYRGVYKTRYSVQSSYANCVSQEQSFYWDNDNQILYVHFEHDQSWYTDDYYYGSAIGYNPETMLYIDDVEYLPLLESVPSILQQEDLQNYKKLSFMNGSVVINNTEGLLDWMIDEEINGQDVFLYYLDSDDITDGSATRSDLVNLAAFYIEDNNIGMSRNTIRVQDIRKSQNISIPVDVFTVADYPDIEDKYINTPIPLVYGEIPEAEATPVDSEGTGNVTFRLGKILTVMGQVQIFEGDVWTDVSTVSTDLSTGSFMLSYIDCRKGGTTTGDVLKCQVLSATGTALTYSPDAIKDLNNIALGIEYNDSNYDTTEWEEEETSLEPIGVIFNKSIELFEAIRQIQSGSNIGFRYEIKADGRRTIRVDDNNRDVGYVVDQTEILNINNLTVNGNSDLLAGIVEINYKKNNESGDYRIYRETSRQAEVAARYRQTPTLSIDTFLQTEALARERALHELDKFDTIPRILPVELLGERWFNLRIYDILTIPITTGFVNLDTGEITGREFYGVWNTKVLSVDPDYENISNNVNLFLIERTLPNLLIKVNETNILNIKVNQSNILRIKVG